MGFGRLDVVTQGRCVNEPLYMFFLALGLLAVSFHLYVRVTLY